VPEAAFARGQSGQGGEHLFQDQLPVLLIASEHLRKKKEGGGGKALICGSLNSNHIISADQGVVEMQNIGSPLGGGLTAVTSLMLHSCSSRTFSTKNGVMAMEVT